ncbi:hypothetical protein RF11_02767 [Thelohanellus kitauei]|uniref:Uncharacterized protein n=1 Tax=Thelohanellus kitauei TaxID=669202 RepID=A0A0C2MUJ6_THEKT|nr:hypothetical protein RF11_02767 [Thelohanellus kitauei]
MFQIEYLDKKAFEFYQANESLSEEVSQMKYALSHRLEMENYRKTLNKEPCGCAPEIAKLKEELNKAHDDLNNKEIELQAIYEQKFELIKIMAEMNDDTSESIDAITLAENEPEINIQHS